MSSDNIKPGYQTTEFWLSLVAKLAAYVTAIAAANQGQWAVALGAVAAGVTAACAYAGSRGLAKVNP